MPMKLPSRVVTGSTGLWLQAGFISAADSGVAAVSTAGMGTAICDTGVSAAARSRSWGMIQLTGRICSSSTTMRSAEPLAGRDALARGVGR